jgi:hypothetical protein
MDLLKVLIELPPGVKIVLGLISAPLATWLTWLKVKKGSISLSKARTERLYELMLREDVDAVPSGALTLAVKEAFNVELDGDKIRFAFKHDNPLLVLRAFKSTLGIVRMSLDGKTCEDARVEQRMTLARVKLAYIVAVLTVYGTLVAGANIATFYLKNPHVYWLNVLFLVNFLVDPVLLWQVLRFEMARKLIAPRTGEMRRPASSLNNPHTQVADKTTPPIQASSPVADTEARSTESEDREEEGDATDRDVTSAIEKLFEAVKEESDKPPTADTVTDE